MKSLSIIERRDASISRVSPRASSPAGLSRFLRWALILGLSSILLACSIVRLAYNQADVLGYWMMNDAFDFNDQQSALVHRRIREWFNWHRHTQLPRYADWLVQAQVEALGPLTPELACQRRQELEALGFEALDHAMPAVAELVLSLSPEQIEHLKAHEAKTNKKFRRDYLPDDPQDRVDAATKFARKIVEYFYGDLSDKQRDALQTDIVALPFNAEVIYGERLRQQQKFTQLIVSLQQQHATVSQAQAALTQLFHEAANPQQEPQHTAMQRWIYAGCQFSANLHNRMSPEQKQKAAERLKSWHDDFLLLSRQQ